MTDSKSLKAEARTMEAKAAAARRLNLPPRFAAYHDAQAQALREKAKRAAKIERSAAELVAMFGVSLDKA